MVVESPPTTGSTSRVTPVLRVSQSCGVVGVTTTGTTAAVVPVVLLIDGT